MGNIYLTGDTHQDIKRFTSKNFPEQKALSKEDHLIQLGDFGMFWNNSISEQNIRKELLMRNFTTLFIDGNHENFELIQRLSTPQQMFENEVNKVYGFVHLKRGHVYKIHNKTFFVMGGAESIDKAYRMIGLSYWREELPSKQEMDFGLQELEKHSWKVDYVLTHEAPESIINQIYKDNTIITSDLPAYFEYIKNNLDFKQWYFGHHHLNKSFENEKFVCLYEKIIKIGN